MTDTTTLTLSSFLLARIAEDEAMARATGVTGFDVKWGGAIVAAYGSSMDGEHVGDVVDQNLAAHIARHDPARVLAECEAKRRIVELHHEVGPAQLLVGPDYYGRDVETANGTPACDACGTPSEYAVRFPCPTLRALAAVYADHPDYREEWRP